MTDGKTFTADDAHTLLQRLEVEISKVISIAGDVVSATLSGPLFTDIVAALEAHKAAGDPPAATPPVPTGGSSPAGGSSGTVSNPSPFPVPTSAPPVAGGNTPESGPPPYRMPDPN